MTQRHGKAPLFFLVLFLLSVILATVAAAADAPPPAVDAGDTAWVLISSALVLFMTPGLAFFYGGLVRRKNILSILMQCFILVCVVSIQWALFGYSLAFGPDVGGWIGNLDWFGLRDVGLDPHPGYAATIPHQVFMVFQMMFAIITPALILGAFAERMKFSSFCVFSLLWATLVYDPVAHWVWGIGGFLRDAGTLDFAGGIVVHINAGIAALVTALVLGKRIGYPGNVAPPHNLPFAVLGTGILWFGWFGFNAGSALGAGKVAGAAFTATHLAGAAAGLTWALIEWIVNERPTMLGLITGAVAGLAAVTPAAGFVRPLGAVWIGIGAAAVCYATAVVMKAQARLRRHAGRLRRARRRRRLGHDRGGALRDQGREPRRRGRPLLRQPGAALDPAQGRRDHRRLVARPDLGHPQGGRRRDGPAGLGARGAGRPRPHRPPRVGVHAPRLTGPATRGPAATPSAARSAPLSASRV